MLAPIIGQYEVLEDSAQVFMARILGANGEPITQASITSINFTAWDLAQSRTTPTTTSTALATTDVLSNTLLTSKPWSVDTIGRNFTHTVPFNVFGQATPEHVVEYDFTPSQSTNQKFKVVFRGRVHEVFMS